MELKKGMCFESRLSFFRENTVLEIIDVPESGSGIVFIKFHGTSLDVLPFDKEKAGYIIYQLWNGKLLDNERAALFLITGVLVKEEKQQ